MATGGGTAYLSSAIVLFPKVWGQRRWTGDGREDHRVGMAGQTSGPYRGPPVGESDRGVSGGNKGEGSESAPGSLVVGSNEAERHPSHTLAHLGEP